MSKAKKLIEGLIEEKTLNPKDMLKSINKSRLGTIPPKDPITDKDLKPVLLKIKELSAALKSIDKYDHRMIIMLHGTSIADQ